MRSRRAIKHKRIRTWKSMSVREFADFGPIWHLSAKDSTV